MRTINFLKVDPPRTCWWPACHGCCKKSVPSCLLVPAWIAQFNSGNYIFISLKLSVKSILISSKSSLNASMTSGQHSQSLRLGRNYRISFCLLNIFKKRNSSQRPKTDMQNTAQLFQISVFNHYMPTENSGHTGISSFFFAHIFQVIPDILTGKFFFLTGRKKIFQRAGRNERTS